MKQIFLCEHALSLVCVFVLLVCFKRSVKTLYFMIEFYYENLASMGQNVS